MVILILQPVCQRCGLRGLPQLQTEVDRVLLPSLHATGQDDQTSSFPPTLKLSSHSPCLSSRSSRRWQLRESALYLPPTLKRYDPHILTISPPPTLQNTEETCAASDTEMVASPVKRKKTGIFEGGHLLDRVAEVSKVHILLSLSPLLSYSSPPLPPTP